MGEVALDEEVVEPTNSKDNIVNRVLRYERKNSQTFDFQEEREFCNDFQQILSLIDPAIDANDTKSRLKNHRLARSNVDGRNHTS
jgi:hypothetical protein